MSKEIESQIAKLALVVSRKKRNDKDLAALREQIKSQLPKSVSLEDLKKWLPRVAESLRVTDPEEDARKTGREDKEWRHPPPNYAPLASNMQDRNIDVGEVIFDELEIHGRQTPDELLKHLGGIEDKMVVMVYISMLADNYLRWYKENNKVKTLELVELTDEEKEARKKRVLEDKKAQRDNKKKGKKTREKKKNILERIKVVDANSTLSHKRPVARSKRNRIKFIDNTEESLIVDMNDMMGRAEGPNINQRRLFSTGKSPPVLDPSPNPNKRRIIDPDE